MLPAAAKDDETSTSREGRPQAQVKNWLFFGGQFCCSQLGTASAPKSNNPTYLPKTRQTFGSRSEARRARAARRGGAEAGALHLARGRHRLAPQLTALRPLRRRTTGVAQKATAGCGLLP